MRATGGGGRYFGVYLGTVLDVDDPDGMGRVRLETDQYSDTDDDPTWAAVARPLAGSVFTVFFTPKVGDQVVFAFLAGDVRQPMVMGYAHASATNKMPGDGAVSATKHAIVVEGVGSITFDEDERTIRLEHADGGSIVLGANSVRIDGSSQVCVNGQAVVLKGFVDNVFSNHLHVVPGAGTSNAPTPLPPIPLASTTEC